MSNFLTVDEVAEKLRVSTRTVRNLCAKGDIPCIYVGSQIRITQEDYENYLFKQRKEVSQNDERTN